MFLYVVATAILGVIAAIVMVLCTKNDTGYVYTSLDRAGRITNILLSVFYLVASPFYMFLGVISEPMAEGILWPVAIIISLIAASASMFCSLGIGFSVALRRKGRSRLSFIIQFAGLAAIALTVLLYCVFVGTLIRSLN